jgi:hypothetical protein
MKKLLSSLLLSGTMAMLVAQTIPLSYDATFTWTPNPPSELPTGYRIEYIKAPVVTNWTYLTFVNSATNAVTVKGLQPGFQYQFRAFAVNAIGTGTNTSNVIPLPATIPSAVSNFINAPK